MHEQRNYIVGMGDRAVDVCTPGKRVSRKAPGFESPIRHLTVASALPRLQMKLQKDEASPASKWLDCHALDEERSAIVIHATRPRKTFDCFEYLFNL